MTTSIGATRVLVVANRTAATPRLLEAVKERAQRSPCVFTLLVPDTAYAFEGVLNPEEPPGTELGTPLIQQAAGSFDARSVIELAVPLLEEASGTEVQAIVGSPDPVAAVREGVAAQDYDEIIVSTLPSRVSRWLRLDLSHKIADVGLPVTTVTARGRQSPAVSS